MTAPIRLQLPYDRPPLSLNDRGHHHVRARAIAAVRRDVGFVARAARMGQHEHVTVALHYVPARAGRRDADNLVATLKTVCDALVDVGLVADDDPAHMTKAMPVIHPPEPSPPPRSPAGHLRRRRLWLEITPGPLPTPGEPVLIPAQTTPDDEAPIDSPRFGPSDERSFARLLGADDRPLALCGPPSPPDDPTGGDDEDGGDGDGEDGPHTLVSIAVTRSDGRQVQASAVLPSELVTDRVESVLRECTVGVLAHLRALDGQS